MSYQQYQQPQYGHSTSTTAREWNGSAWVPVVNQTNVAYSHYSSQFAPAAASVTPSAIHNSKAPVDLYTEYYHGWQAAMKQYEMAVPSAERKRNVELALYYANESSRAAHHYYGNPNVPPPFQLPPAPPVIAAANAPYLSSEAPTPHHNQDRPATSLTSYIKRCLDQCATIEQRQQVQAMVEQRIAAAIQTRELNTKDWSQEPLIRIDGSAGGAAVSASPLAHHHREPGHTISKSNSHNSQYGHPRDHDSTNPAFVASSISSSSHFSPRPVATTSYSNSYYGPAVTAAPDADKAQSSPPYTREINRNSKKQPSKKRPSSWNGANAESNNNDDDDGMDRSSRALLKRQARFGIGTASSITTGSTDLQDYSKYMGLSTINSSGTKVNLTEEDYERMTVKGECQVLEKDYLRLTAPPKPEMVRPESILRQHLDNLVSSKNVRNNDDNSVTTSSKMYASKDYLWMCSQYKALRQDLTIQRIQNDLAVDVYEAHARLALREGDLNEFNQCQTQLPDLYLTNHTFGARDEFRAYRLLYHVYLTTTIATEHAAATLEITKSLAIPNPGPALQHALEIRRTVAQQNYASFFRLHEEAPNLGKYLTERMVPIMRFRALKMIVKVYRPWLEIDHCRAVLGFGGSVQDDPQQQEKQKKCLDFLDSCGAKVEEKPNQGLLLLTKESDDQIHEPVTELPNSLLK